MADYRALCARMADELDHYRQLLTDDRREAHALATEARALLAQPEPEGATAKELRQIFDDQSGYIGDEQVMWSSDFVAAARALLARWGRPTPQPPIAGEVAELVEGLKLISDGMSTIGHESDSWFVARAADLLQRQHPQPVAVSERLPGPEDCEAGECWAWDTAAESWNRTHYALCNHFTHWLPANALPTPEAKP